MGQGVVEMLDVARAASYRADGVFGEQILELVEHGRSGLGLGALGPEHPVTQLLGRILGSEKRPLNAANALALSGFHTLFVEVVGQCNERCAHCYAESGPERAEALSRDTCEAIIEDAAELGFSRVQLTGGDPLLCEFLPALAARVTDAGMWCEIYTNGLALTDRLLAELAGARPSLAFSFYSVDPAIHDAITRTPGSQQRTAAAIERTVAAGLSVRVAVVVMEQNAATVAETIKYVSSLGAGYVSSTASHAVGRGSFYSGAVPVCDALEPPPTPSRARGLPLSAGAGAEAGAAAEADRPGPRPQGKLCVTYAGEVVPCIFNRVDVVGRIGERRLRDIARAPEVPPARAQGLEALLTSCREAYLCRTCQLTACALQACRGE